MIESSEFIRNILSIGDAEQAAVIADKIGFPVLMRPSFVLGGRAMEIVYSKKQLIDYVVRSADVTEGHPILIDEFLEDAFEFDVDALCDGESVHIGGIMQHIEEAGIHSGDSACVLPPYRITGVALEEIIRITKVLALKLNVKGLINLQFAYKDEKVYINRFFIRLYLYSRHYIRLSKIYRSELLYG